MSLSTESEIFRWNKMEQMVEAKRIERQEQKIRELFGSEDESEFDDEGDNDD